MTQINADLFRQPVRHFEHSREISRWHGPSFRAQSRNLSVAVRHFEHSREISEAKPTLARRQRFLDSAPVAALLPLRSE